jgi:small-conductance mechanosensitive channel
VTLFGHTVPVSPWIALPIYLVFLLLVCRLVSGGLEALFRRRTRRTPSRLDDQAIDAVRAPLVLGLFLTGLRLGLDGVDLPPRAELLGLQVVKLGLILLLALLGMRLLGVVLLEWGRRVDGATQIAGPASALGKIIIVAVALIMAADALGIAIAPLVTTLGLGSLAVALALQDTLANFFSGLYLLADKPIRVGDYVRLDSGQEGYVESIGWRSTRIRHLMHNIVVVPNQKLSQAIVTNFNLPEPRMALPLVVSVAYGTDPAPVEHTLLSVARDALGSVPGMVAEPAPAVRLNPGFGESSLDFTLVLHIDQFESQYAVQSELRKRILAAFAASGIHLPLPQRVVHLRTSGSGSDGRQPAMAGPGDGARGST